ncbi:trp operon repressor [Candidatus Gracilibacteria bacterium]|nr:trp operon repressor [Candidatus Gracilibacteria bacterium]
MTGLKKRDFKFDKNSDKLFEAILSLKNIKECELFFRDIMTISELQAITERFTVAQDLNEGKKTYRKISEETGVSTATITRIANWIENGKGGYKLVLNRLFGAHHHTNT